MKRKAIVKAVVVAEVIIHEDAIGNQEIESFEDIRDMHEFEVIEII